MQQALPLAEKFEDTHAQLLDVLQRMEPELRGAEAAGPEAETQVKVSQPPPRLGHNGSVPGGGTF